MNAKQKRQEIMKWVNPIMALPLGKRKVLSSIPNLKNCELSLMAVCENYSMVRRKGGSPFVLDILYLVQI